MHSRRCAKLLATGRRERVKAKLKGGRAVGFAPSARRVFVVGGGGSATVRPNGSFRIKLRGKRRARIGAAGMEPSRTLKPR